jgi:demethylmenaquinone methyltransferase/2-methoxy-6-polyprenyl-1,4-benzoquinol methylase
MTDQTGANNKEHVRKMFGKIAHRYDLLNRVMTFGQDIQWRKILVKKIALSDKPVVLDIGCGTGDLAKEVRKQHPDTWVVAADFTPEMVLLGANAADDPGIDWVIADAQNLPFANNKFDAVISGYLLRNVPDVDQALIEQYRVSADGARVASLDTTPPEKNILFPFISFYLNYVIPFFGRMILGDSSAYEYLSSSTQEFLDADKLAEKIKGAGYSKVKYIKKMFKTMAIHWGIKEGSANNKP